MSVKNRTIVLVTIVFLLLSGGYCYQGISLSQERLAEKIGALEAASEQEVAVVVQEVFSPYAKRIESLVNSRPAIVEAFAKRDRELLYRQALPAYTVLQKENPYLQSMPFILPDGTNFLRMHAPELYGDDQGKIRPMVQAVAARQTQHTGFEFGRHGLFYRVGQPIFQAGNFIGVVEFGIRARQVSDTVRKRLKIPVAEYYLSTELAKADQIPRDGKGHGKYTLRDEEDSAFSLLPAELSLDAGCQRMTLQGKTYMLFSKPIFTDFDGRVIGGIALLQEISAEVAQGRRYLMQSLLLTAILLGGALVILVVGFGGFVDQLENSEKMQGKLVRLLEEKVVILKKQEEELKGYHENLEGLVKERTSALEKSLAEVKTLRGFLPICASCKNIRDDQGYWTQIESYISNHSEAEFTHSICPQCSEKLYPGLLSRKGSV